MDRPQTADCAISASLPRPVVVYDHSDAIGPSLSFDVNMTNEVGDRVCPRESDSHPNQHNLGFNDLLNYTIHFQLIVFVVRHRGQVDPQ